MSTKKIYSVTGLFDSADGIINAVEGVIKAGYKNYDAHTPYPIHGMSDAMRLKPSKLGYVALALGLSGAALALALMWWIKSVNYPQNIGGKPTFALPAFIPVTFEVTVLLASVGTVLAMLFIFFKLPNNSHPLHDTNYMKSVSNDKFGMSIEAKDSKFNENDAKALLRDLGAHSIETIYYDEELLSFKAVLLKPSFVGFLVVVVILTSGTSYFFLNKFKYYPPRNWMWEQPRVNAQAASEFFSDGFGMRNPAEGTVARGFMPYEFAGMPDSAAKGLVNPVAMTEKSLLKGKAKYDTYCSPCHGFQAKGDSRLRGQFPNPPSLHSEKIRGWADGQLYHVITMGQNVMPSYARNLKPEERWQVINYIRALQRALNAREEDLK